MHKHLERLVKAVQKGNGWTEGGDTVSVSRTGQTAGAAYEKVRNAVEYEEEHLLRRNAVRRILHRRRAADEEDSSISRGEAVITELIWAKYLPNKRVPATKIVELDAIIDKYDQLFESLDEDAEGVELYDWLLDVMSTEIEYAIDPPRSKEALVTLMFDHMREEIVWSVDKGLGDQEKDMLTYIAIHRALLKSNPATLRYRVFMLYFPKWGSADTAMVHDVEERLGTISKAVEEQIKHPYADQLYRLMRKYALVFWSIEDVVKDRPGEALGILADSEQLKREVTKAVHARYGKFRTKLYRVVGRAVLFLFITKMLLAIILEVPYDLYVLGALELYPLAINVVFHPLFLTLIGVTVRIPAKKNTKKVIELVSRVLNKQPGDQSMNVVFNVKRPWTHGMLGKFFTLFYGLTFLFSYGVIAWFLATVLAFNVLSIILFLLFFSLVTFFGIKIRQSVRELLVVERQGGIIGTMFDFFMLPVVRLGRWITLRARKVNIFIFFLDFIVEAPFKLGIEMIEGWIAFIREKKEEL